MEEALVSRVSSFTSVLSLPNGGQLGYRGSVINFVNELGTVAAQLPRAPKDTGIILYLARGTRKDGSAYRELVRVRRAAVEEHLRFFAKYHQLYIRGIENPNRTCKADYWLVAPFTEAMIDKVALLPIATCYPSPHATYRHLLPITTCYLSPPATYHHLLPITTCYLSSPAT